MAKQPPIKTVYQRLLLYARVIPILAILLPALLLSGCVTLSDPETSQESAQDVIATLKGEQIFSQTIEAHRPRLNGLTLFARPGDADASGNTGPAKLVVELYPLSSEEAGLTGVDEAPIFRTSVIVAGSGPLNISLPPLPGPGGQHILITLSSENRPVSLLGRKGDVYPPGVAYENGSPVDADLAFQTTYDYDPSALLQDVRGWIRNAWLILPLALAFLLPGWLLLELSGLRSRFDAGEQAALSTGLSLALIALLMLWTSFLGLHWTAQAVMFGMGMAIGLAFWRLIQPILRVNVQLGGTPPVKEEAKPISPLTGLPGWAAALALMGIFLVSFGVRMAQVRDLATPPWVDSVHHALIARLILQYGGYPPTYAPFLDLLPTQYHAGYHAALATFTWLSRLDIPSSMLISGQFLNALAVFTAYLFATTLTRSRLTGLLAALATGLFSPMPAYYTSWGRYTELAGLLILPIPLAMLRLALPETSELALPESSLPRWKKPAASALFLAIVATGGLFLVHYRVTAFLAILLVADALVQLAGGFHIRPALWKQYTGRTLGTGGLLCLGALILSLPWIWPNLTRLLLPALERGNGVLQQPFSDFSWRYLTAALGNYLLALAGVGLVWGLFQHKRFAFTIPLWVAGMFLLANLGVFRLPGWWLVNNTSVAILLFLPISLLAGYILDQALFAWNDILPLNWRRVYGGIIALSFAGLALFGAIRLLPILNPTTFLARAADLPAMEWIEANIPPKETVLINPFRWGYNLYAGNDGGYWISPLAGRKTLPPPVIYGFGDAAANRATGAVSQSAIDNGADPKALADLMRSNGIRYLYIGARGGPFSAYALSHSPLFNMLYNQNGTWVFTTVP